MIEEPQDTRVDVNWGYFGPKRRVQGGQGKVTPSAKDPNAFDVWINKSVYWSNVPADVWAMTIGGYPVVKKWLSYREYKVLGRALREQELTYVTEVVRRLAALLALGAELDANYRAVAAGP